MTDLDWLEHLGLWWEAWAMNGIVYAIIHGPDGPVSASGATFAGAVLALRAKWETRRAA